MFKFSFLYTHRRVIFQVKSNSPVTEHDDRWFTRDIHESKRANASAENFSV
jgi:hypothetical protein